MELEDFLEMFNNNDLDVKKYFNDYQTWFSILKRKGLFDEIDPHNASDHEVWQNEYLLWLYDNDKEKFYDWTQKLLSDIEVEDGKVYWVGNRSELSALFCSGRNQDISQDTIETLLSGEGEAWEPYWNTTDDVYRDVIEELNPKNIEILRSYIVKNLEGQELSPDTELMENIASSQGHPDFWEISDENVNDIIEDKESMESLLKNELSDLKSELYSIHSSAYNSAYESDIWDDIWSEINTYFEGKGEWIYRPHPYKKETQVEKFKIPILDFDGFIKDYLWNNKDYGNSGTIEYHGGFLELLREENDCLSVRVPDYPNPRTVDENINSYFTDYI